MWGKFRKRKGTKVSLVVEYALDYSEKVDKNNVNDIVDYKDILRDPRNIVAIRDVGFKAI